MIWYCCDDYGLSDDRDQAIIDFARGKANVRISVFPFISKASEARLNNFIESEKSLNLQIGGHLFLSEFPPITTGSDVPLFFNKEDLSNQCSDSQKMFLVKEEIIAQLVRLSNNFKLDFLNFHHNIHLSSCFIRFLKLNSDIGIFALRNVAVVPAGLGYVYTYLFHFQKFRLYNQIRTYFSDPSVDIYMSANRFNKWKVFLNNRNVELMFHPGDNRPRYVDESKSFEK